MTAFLVANLAPIMFGSMLLFLLIGYPVAFALAACGFGFGPKNQKGDGSANP